MVGLSLAAGGVAGAIGVEPGDDWVVPGVAWSGAVAGCCPMSHAVSANAQRDAARTFVFIFASSMSSAREAKGVPKARLDCARALDHLGAASRMRTPGDALHVQSPLPAGIAPPLCNVRLRLETACLVLNVSRGTALFEAAARQHSGIDSDGRDPRSGGGGS